MHVLSTKSSSALHHRGSLLRGSDGCGETFLASLSLALAAIAESYQGARKLSTVCFDEGFGALDQEALETAMAALTSLKAQGRIVGIISHVEEVKRQVTCQIQVTRDPITKNSTVTVVGGVRERIVLSAGHTGRLPYEKRSSAFARTTNCSTESN